MSFRLSSLLACGLGALLASSGFAQDKPATTVWNPWEPQHSGTTQPLRGIHAVGEGVAWASGDHGTVLRTEDSGYVWQRCAVPPGGAALDFRSVWGWDAQNAIVMSSGPGGQSRLYKTSDGCAHWRALATNQEQDGFWDGLAFSDARNGYLLGDPVHGRFTLLRTHDGGEHWKAVASHDLDLGGAPLGAFAASNQAMTLVGTAAGLSVPWFGTSGFGTSGAGTGDVSGGGHPYVYSGDLKCTMEMAHRNPELCLTRSLDFPHVEVPMAGAGVTQGVFALALRSDAEGTLHAVAVGGDYKDPGQGAGTAAAWDAKDGKWTAARKPPHGYRSSVAWDEADSAWIAVGTNGADVSYDDGQTWSQLGNDNYNAISLPWLVGPAGRIAKLTSLKGK
jgi:hypothetical protein